MQEKGVAMTTLMVGATTALRGRLAREWDDERGDVPPGSMECQRVVVPRVVKVRDFPLNGATVR